jgi:hypothetical protein
LIRTVALVAVLAAGLAHAQIVELHEGETIAPLGIVPLEKRDAVRELTALGSTDVGYVYDDFQLGGVSVWTSNGRYCLYTEQRYWVLTEHQACVVLGLTRIVPPRPYHFPSGLIDALAIAILAALGFVLARRRRTGL